jgi:hypothetical protein
MDSLKQLEETRRSNLDIIKQAEGNCQSNAGKSAIDNIKRIEEKYYDHRKSEIHRDLFKLAEKEYLNFPGPNKPEKPEKKLVYTREPDKHFFFEGREHQFKSISGERTCNNCGLVSGPISLVSEYGCWKRAIKKYQNKAIVKNPDTTTVKNPDTTIAKNPDTAVVKNLNTRIQSKTDISFKYESFCVRRNIPNSVLSVRDRSRIVENIRKIDDAEKPRKKTLPNLNILTYQICKRLNIAMDEKLLNKFPESEVPHDRCRKIFQTLGWKYIE